MPEHDRGSFEAKDNALGVVLPLLEDGREEVVVVLDVRRSDFATWVGDDGCV